VQEKSRCPFYGQAGEVRSNAVGSKTQDRRAGKEVCHACVWIRRPDLFRRDHRIRRSPRQPRRALQIVAQLGIQLLFDARILEEHAQTADETIERAH
jgi:hypothetical protein